MAKTYLREGDAPDNTDAFHEAFINLLKEHSFDREGKRIDITIGDLRFKLEDIRNCAPECRRRARVCDANGKNCHIRVWCEC